MNSTGIRQFERENKNLSDFFLSALKKYKLFHHQNDSSFKSFFLKKTIRKAFFYFYRKGYQKEGSVSYSRRSGVVRGRSGGWI